MGLYLSLITFLGTPPPAGESPPGAGQFVFIYLSLKFPLWACSLKLECIRILMNDIVQTCCAYFLDDSRLIPNEIRVLLSSQFFCSLTDILFHCNFSFKNLKVLTKKNTLRIRTESLLKNTLREKKNKENNSGTNKYLLKGVKRNLIFTSKQNDDIIFFSCL